MKTYEKLINSGMYPEEDILKIIEVDPDLSSDEKNILAGLIDENKKERETAKREANSLLKFERTVNKVNDNFYELDSEEIDVAISDIINIAGTLDDKDKSFTNKLLSDYDSEPLGNALKIEIMKRELEEMKKEHERTKGIVIGIKVKNKEQEFAEAIEKATIDKEIDEKIFDEATEVLKNLKVTGKELEFDEWFKSLAELTGKDEKAIGRLRKRFDVMVEEEEKFRVAVAENQKRYETAVKDMKEQWSKGNRKDFIGWVEHLMAENKLTPMHIKMLYDEHIETMPDLVKLKPEFNVAVKDIQKQWDKGDRNHFDGWVEGIVRDSNLDGSGIDVLYQNLRELTPNIKLMDIDELKKSVLNIEEDKKSVLNIEEIQKEEAKEEVKEGFWNSIKTAPKKAIDWVKNTKVAKWISENKIAAGTVGIGVIALAVSYLHPIHSNKVDTKNLNLKSNETSVTQSIQDTSKENNQSKGQTVNDTKEVTTPAVQNAKKVDTKAITKAVNEFAKQENVKKQSVFSSVYKAPEAVVTNYDVSIVPANQNSVQEDGYAKDKLANAQSIEIQQPNVPYQESRYIDEKTGDKVVKKWDIVNGKAVLVMTEVYDAKTGELRTATYEKPELASMYREKVYNENKAMGEEQAVDDNAWLLTGNKENAKQEMEDASNIIDNYDNSGVGKKATKLPDKRIDFVPIILPNGDLAYDAYMINKESVKKIETIPAKKTTVSKDSGIGL